MLYYHNIEVGSHFHFYVFDRFFYSLSKTANFCSPFVAYSVDILIKKFQKFDSLIEKEKKLDNMSDKTKGNR